MRRIITVKQLKVLNFIKTFIEENSYSPSIREIADNFSISAKGAQDNVNALRRKGYIRSEYRKPRTIAVIKEA
jgi:repressor LexA